MIVVNCIYCIAFHCTHSKDQELIEKSIRRAITWNRKTPTEIFEWISLGCHLSDEGIDWIYGCNAFVHLSERLNGKCHEHNIHINWLFIISEFVFCFLFLFKWNITLRPVQMEKIETNNLLLSYLTRGKIKLTHINGFGVRCKKKRKKKEMKNNHYK